MTDFQARYKLVSVLFKLGIKSAGPLEATFSHTDIENAIKLMSANMGTPSQIIMSTHSYDVLVKHFQK